MQDLLPLHVRRALAAEESARVRAHVASCASCAAELAVLESAGALFTSATPSVDTSRITAALPAAPTTGRPVLRLEPKARPRFTMSRYAFAAAASLLLVATISFGGLRIYFAGSERGTPDRASRVTTVALAVPVDLVGAGGLADLESAELEALLAALDEMEMTVAAEPSVIRHPLSTLPEGG
jgi:hypothetical protein